MDKNVFFKAAGEVLKALFFCVIACLLIEALFAVFVKAFAPSYVTITVVNWAIQAVAVFVCSLLFIRRDRAMFKGFAVGLLSGIVTMLLFAAFAGGFFLDGYFAIQLLLCALCGGAGGALSANLRKE